MAPLDWPALATSGKRKAGGARAHNGTGAAWGMLAVRPLLRHVAHSAMAVPSALALGIEPFEAGPDDVAVSGVLLDGDAVEVFTFCG